MRITAVALALAGCAGPSLHAVDDQLAVEMGSDAQLAVLDNDVGVAAKRQLAIVAPPEHGDATLGDDGVLLYHPAAGYLGDDTLQYRVADPDKQEARATVAITVGCATCAIGLTAKLSWDPNPAGDMVTGYRVYFGSTMDPKMMAQLDDIAVTRPGFDPAAPGVTYDEWKDLHLRFGTQACFALTAYNANGESGFSNVACKIATAQAMNFSLH